MGSVMFVRKIVKTMKWRILVFCLFCLSIAPVCLASMPRSEMYVGGVGPGCTMGYVQEIYGEPTSRETQSFAEGITVLTYNYENKLIVRALKSMGSSTLEADMDVYSVESYAPSLTTPSGFAVGMSYAAVTRRFGLGQVTPRGYINKPLDGCTYYAYSAGPEMIFAVDGHNIIRAIHVSVDI